MQPQVLAYSYRLNIETVVVLNLKLKQINSGMVGQQFIM